MVINTNVSFNRCYNIIRKNPGKYVIEFRIVPEEGAGTGKTYGLSPGFSIDGNTRLLKDIEAAFGGKITWLKTSLSDRANKKISGL